jgi:hemoglobin
VRILACSFALTLTMAATPVPAQDVQTAKIDDNPGAALTTSQATSQAAPSLYDRLGGVYPIAVVVDDFVDRLLTDERLNANPRIAQARKRVPREGLKFHVTTLVCQVTGGPCKYFGRDMKTAHAHLKINGHEWQAMLADFRTTLDKFKVPVHEQQELFAIVNGTRGEIVIGGE